jgi:hypothetical protein
MRIILTVLLAFVLFGCSIETGLQQQMQNESRQYSISSSRVTHTDIVANPTNGLNEMTLATNDYGTTETLYEDESSVRKDNHGFPRVNSMQQESQKFSTLSN